MQNGLCSKSLQRSKRAWRLGPRLTSTTDSIEKAFLASCTQQFTATLSCAQSRQRFGSDLHTAIVQYCLFLFPFPARNYFHWQGNR